MEGIELRWEHRPDYNIWLLVDQDEEIWASLAEKLYTVEAIIYHGETHNRYFLNLEKAKEVIHRELAGWTPF